MQGFKTRVLALACCAIVAGGIGMTAQAATPAASSAKAGNITANPFYKPSTLPFQAPDFSKIKDSDYQPAMEEGMQLQRAEIEKIADNPAAPTFDNTLVAMEKSGQMLMRVMLAFSTVAGANTDDTLQKVQETEAPKLSAHQDSI